MGMGAAAGNLTTVGIQPDGTTQQDGAIAVGSVLSAAAAAGWTTGLVRRIESTNVRATALADAPNGGVLPLKPGGVTPRAVGVWNSATSMGGPVQRVKPVGHKR